MMAMSRVTPEMVKHVEALPLSQRNRSTRTIERSVGPFAAITDVGLVLTVDYSSAQFQK